MLVLPSTVRVWELPEVLLEDECGAVYEHSKIRLASSTVLLAAAADLVALELHWW
jgi:hypothetical protein